MRGTRKFETIGWRRKEGKKAVLEVDRREVSGQILGQRGKKKGKGLNFWKKCPLAIKKGQISAGRVKRDPDGAEGKERRGEAD